MPTPNTAATSSAAAPVPPVLSGDDAARIEALRAKLPEGWTVELEARPGVEWTATVPWEAAPLDRPWFMVLRSPPRRAVATVRLPDGTARMTDSYAGLAPILDPIPEAVFGFMATVDAEGWQDARH